MTAADATLPIPPLRLRRIRLHGVGPDTARFDPLDLDFSTPDGAASRVLLSLTNTGGKSTLITLVSSLVVPAARAQVGRKSIGDYVLTGDTSHIVCEWEDSTTGLRTITGTVMEWKDGRRQPAHKQRSVTNMHRAWYLFRTGSGLPGIDDLPFVIGDRRATFASYLDTLTDQLSQYPDTRWVHTRTQQEWTQALTEYTSIDPVLFSYQMRMNDDEAGAKALLEPFSSDDNVVRFFISALNNDRDIADFTTKLSEYAQVAVQRPKLAAITAFCSEIGPAISLIADRATTVDEAAAASLNARTRCAELAGAAYTRLTSDRALRDQQDGEVAGAETAFATADRQYRQISDIRLQLRLENARAKVAAAQHELEETTQAFTLAEREAKAWDAVEVLLDVEAARERRDAAQSAYEEADAGLGPLRDQVAAAAAQVAGRLTSLIKENQAGVKAAEALREQADNDARKAREQFNNAARRKEDARRQLGEINDLIRDAAAAVDRARDAGWLNAGETAEQCLRRWQDLRADAKTRAEEATRRAEAADAAGAEAERAKDELDTTLADLRARAGDDQRAVKAFDHDLARIAEQSAIEQLLGGPALTSTEVERARALAETAATTADRAAANHQGAADSAQEDLRHLDETGTAPTGPDVMEIASALAEHRIGAVTGLQWIENNLPNPEDRRAFITEHPEIAGGVIITDPARLTAADEYLSDLKLRIRTPVAVVANPTPSTSADTDIAAAARFVVVPHRATWDREWAKSAREEAEALVTREGAAAANSRAAARSYRDAIASCTAFMDRWADTRRDDLVDAASASAAAVVLAEQQRQNLIDERERQREAGKTARNQAEVARKAITRADTGVNGAQKLSETTTAADAAAQRRVIVETERQQAEEQEGLADAAEKQAQQISRDAADEAAQARSDVTTFGRELAALGVEQPAPDPGGNLDTIRVRWEALSQELSAAERGMREAELLDRANKELSKAQRRCDRYEAEVLTRAAELSRLPAASSPDSLVGAQQRARDAAVLRQREQLQADQRKENAESQLKAAQPTAGDRQNHVDLTNFPEWQPATVDDIPALLERLERRNIDLRERRDEAEQAVKDAILLRGELEADVEAFEAIVAMWGGDPAPGQQALPGSKRDAFTAMRASVDEHNKADTHERDMRGQLGNAVAAARALANNPRWRELEAPLVLRVRGLQDVQLIAEAPTLGGRIRAVAASAEGDLAAMDTHRQVLRDGLVAMCREQRRLLREVSNSSRLPAGLGELTGQPSIRIRFEEANDDEVHARLGDRVDAWALELAANPKRAASPDARARWLADAVRDTVLDRSRAGAWSIEILKPRIDGQVMYCPPERIPHEFSGGQVLTLAVLVYCALSRVRSAHRTGGARPPGTLLLDNPFGAASQETLMQMQHRLAAHSGIQLVCATGLNEPGVERAFSGVGSVIIKLRNDGDLRRNLSFLRLRARTVDGVDIAKAITGSRPTDAPQNWVDSTRYEIRQ